VGRFQSCSTSNKKAPWNVCGSAESKGREDEGVLGEAEEAGRKEELVYRV